ncbi:Benzoate 1,2-dioxygenase electron transfer component [subsurface metagenome]
MVLVAGGTGITPFVSFLELACDENSTNSIRLFYGVRAPEMIVYKEIIQECKLRLAAFSFHLFIEDEGEQPIEGSLTGTLDIDRILDRVQVPEKAILYLSGPLAMIQNLRPGLTQQGINAENIRVDEWE